MIRLLAACIVVVGLGAGCLPTLSTQSAQPPGRTARLDEFHGFWGIKGYQIELSQGVALAMTCYDGGPCKDLAVVSEDPSIAEIRRASLGTLERAGIYNQQTAAAVVVIGKRTGKTRIKVRSAGGSRVVPIEIIAPPGPPVTQATAGR
jgi:hypothetical protein